MRHGKKTKHLSRSASHRKAMMANMASSLIEHKRINTTTAKAKVLRKFVEPLVTKSKTDTTHNRRLVFAKLHNKNAVSELFREIAPKVGDRPGGYTRIIKLGNRLGDNAEMAMIELVDFNEVYDLSSGGKKKTRRSGRTRRGGKKKTASTEDGGTPKSEDGNKDNEPLEKSAEKKPQQPDSEEKMKDKKSEEASVPEKPESTSEGDNAKQKDDSNAENEKE